MGMPYYEMPRHMRGSAPAKPDPYLWLWMAGTPAACLAVMALFFGLMSHLQHKRDAEETAEVASAPYHVGDIVRTRVANFRGVVTNVICYRGCQFQVRFTAASMQPQWMYPGEIELAGGK